MTTRFTIPLPPGSLETGYSNQKTSEIIVPSCGLEDVDVALFNLFDKELRLFVKENDAEPASNLKKVPVVFAAGEKWALLKNGRPIRDKTGSLILPLITIMRTGIEQSTDVDVSGRGINQQTGELVIKRKLHRNDREYQNLINRLDLRNQQNIAVNPEDPKLLGQLTTDRKIKDLSSNTDIRNGTLMLANRLKNIQEIITIPSPQFFTANYEVTFWTQYVQQMNSLTEAFMSSFLPQGRCFKLTTHKGYWFVANVGESFEQDVNFDDMSNAERMIKCSFEIKVPAYLLASEAPGVPIAARKYITSPMIEFNTNISDVPVVEELPLDYPALGADDPTLPLQENQRKRREDLREDYQGPLGTSDGVDPATKSYVRGRPPGKYIRVGERLVKGKVISSFTGETSYKDSTAIAEFGEFTTISK